MTNIEPIQAFTDNYIWLLTNGSSAVVVDPGDPAPVAATLAHRGLNLSGIIITHHHFDHVGGLETLASQWECPVWGPDSSFSSSPAPPLLAAPKLPQRLNRP